MKRVTKLVTIEVVASVSIMVEVDDRRDVELCIDTVVPKLRFKPESVPKSMSRGMKARIVEGFTKIVDYDLKEVK